MCTPWLAKAAVPGLWVEGAPLTASRALGCCPLVLHSRPRCREPPPSDGRRRLAEALSLSGLGACPLWGLARMPPEASAWRCPWCPWVPCQCRAPRATCTKYELPLECHPCVNMACCVCLCPSPRMTRLLTLLLSFPAPEQSPPSGISWKHSAQCRTRVHLPPSDGRPPPSLASISKLLACVFASECPPGGLLHLLRAGLARSGQSGPWKRPSQLQGGLSVAATPSVVCPPA